jgi:Protein of unknown function (DUF1018).
MNYNPKEMFKHQLNEAVMAPKRKTADTEARLKQKRQYFHQLLIKAGATAHKEMILDIHFGVTSSKELTEAQLDEIILEYEQHLGIDKKQYRKPVKRNKEQDEVLIRRLRNKILLVLAERGIRATAKDWKPVNDELSAKRYQWIMTPDQQQKGIVNHKGLLAFTTPESLEKLFRQLCRIRDNEKEHNAIIKNLTEQN